MGHSALLFKFSVEEEVASHCRISSFSLSRETLPVGKGSFLLRSTPKIQASDPASQASEPASQALEPLRPGWLALRLGWPALRPGSLARRPAWQALRPAWLALRHSRGERTDGRTDGQTYGRTDVQTYRHTDGRAENLPILQDFVPYRGRCPATAQL